MEFKIQDVSSVKKNILVEISGFDVNKEIENAYGELKKNVKIKGFRKGKAPRSLIEKLYQNEINADVINALISSTFPDVAKKTDFKILGEPHIKPGELQKDKEFEYEVTIEVEPEIADIDFSGLQLKKSVYNVSDKHINTHLEMIRKNAADYEKVEGRAAQKDDYISIDYEAFQDGKRFEEIGDVKDFKMKIGDPNIFAEFNENIVGMNIDDEKSIKVTIPENSQNQKISGAQVDIKVTLKEIRKQILPELNDDFAKGYGSYTSLQDLKDKIYDNLRKGYEKRAHQEIIEQIFTAIMEKIDFELPEVLVKQEQAVIVEDALKTFSYYDTSLEKLGLKEEEFAEKYRSLAEQQVRRYLILKHLIEQEKPELSEENIEEAYRESAETVGMSVENIKAYYKGNKDNFEYFKHTLLEKKIIDIIISKSEIEEVMQEEEEQKNSGETAVEA